MIKRLILISLSFLFITNAFALNLSRVKTWSTSDILTAADLNAEFDNIVNHSIVNADIDANAAILASKLDLRIPGAIGSTTPNTGAFTTLSSTGNTTIGDAVTDTLQINSNAITLEGNALDDHEILVQTGTLTGDSTLTIPNITGTLVTSNGSGGNIDIGTYSLTANTLVSDVATGTAPLTVSSTTKVTNLGADTLDTYDTSTTAAASKIYVSDVNSALPVAATPSDIRIKGWVNLTGTGTIAINDSYNVSGITDNGTGDYTITWDTDFASANYCVMGIAEGSAQTDYSGQIVEIYGTSGLTAGAARIFAGQSARASEVQDSSTLCIMAIGDQ